MEQLKQRQNKINSPNGSEQQQKKNFSRKDIEVLSVFSTECI